MQRTSDKEDENEKSDRSLTQKRWSTEMSHWYCVFSHLQSDGSSTVTLLLTDAQDTDMIKCGSLVRLRLFAWDDNKT